jgi:hypothetical protein
MKNILRSIVFFAGFKKSEPAPKSQNQQNEQTTGTKSTSVKKVKK